MPSNRRLKSPSATREWRKEREEVIWTRARGSLIASKEKKQQRLEKRKEINFIFCCILDVDGKEIWVTIVSRFFSSDWGGKCIKAKTARWSFQWFSTRTSTWFLWRFERTLTILPLILWSILFPFSVKVYQGFDNYAFYSKRAKQTIEDSSRDENVYYVWMEKGRKRSERGIEARSREMS